MTPLTRFRQSLAVWLTVLPMRGPRRAREPLKPEAKSDTTLQALFVLLLCAALPAVLTGLNRLEIFPLSKLKKLTIGN